MYSYRSSNPAGLFCAVACVFICTPPVLAVNEAPAATEFQELKAMVTELKQEVAALREENAFCKMRLKATHLATEEELSKLSSESGIKPAYEERLSKLENCMGDIKVAADALGIVEGTMKDASGGRQTYGVGRFNVYFQAPIADKTYALVWLDGIGGNGPDWRLTSLSGVNGNAGSLQSQDGIDRVRVREAWVETEVDNLPLGEKLTATAGKIDLTNYFDANEVANDEMTQFEANSLVNNLAVPFPASPSPGARLAWEIGYGFTAQAGVGKWDDSGDQLFNQALGIWEIDYATEYLFGLPGNYRFYNYVGKPRYTTDDDGDGNEDVGSSDVSWGFGFSADQKVLDRVTLFGRFGRSDKGFVKRGYNTPVHNSLFWSTGGQIDNPLSFLSVTGRGKDILGIGFSQVIPYQDDRTYLPDFGIAQQVRPARESLWEVYYRYQLNEKIQVSPFLQVTKNTGSFTDYHANNESVLYGVRSRVNF
ncbi:MAG: carbohydrate porin [Candidatus Omnitrophica bacterium]|nr:carbohydrate porin [Candidatus Omnitrophota bacterium]